VGYKNIFQFGKNQNQMVQFLKIARISLIVPSVYEVEPKCLGRRSLETLANTFFAGIYTF
jgi:hypothetical protein